MKDQILSTFENLIHNNNGWENSEDSFYEDLYSKVAFDEEYNNIHGNWKEDYRNLNIFVKDDIIFVKQKDKYHVYLIIHAYHHMTKSKYTAFEISPFKLDIENSNNSITIHKYSDILNVGIKSDCSVYINLDKAYTLFDSDLKKDDKVGIWRGRINKKFLDFLALTINKEIKGVKNNERF